MIERRTRTGWWVAATVGFLTLGCSAAAPASGAAPALAAQESSSDSLIPPGLGTLRQDEITLRLQQGDLLIKVTPLPEWLIRLTAPDTYHRLSALKRTQGEALKARIFVDRPLLVLVQLFSNAPNVAYEPEDLLLVNQGLKYRPLAIQAITPGWGTQRLAQQETQLALYAFDPAIDLEVDLAVEYDAAIAAGWEQRLPALQAEEAKILARAGSEGGEGR